MKRRYKCPFCRLLAGAGMLLTTIAWCNAAEASLADCIDATCRISTADGSRGSGCAFENSQGRVFVLTAAHVVGRNRTVQCEFWRDGHRSVPLAGEVLATGLSRTPSGSVDAAIIAVPISSFAGVLPGSVPIAPRGYRLSPGETVTSVGCAKGAWATGWKGHVLGYDGSSLCFTPPPADGRSGSALFDAEGERIVGLIWGRNQREGKGHAVTVENLYRALNFTRTGSGWVHSPLQPLGYTERAQCSPYGCAPRSWILPYRNYQQQGEYYRNQLQNQRMEQLEKQAERENRIWPTLPPQVRNLQGNLKLEAKPQPLEEKAKQEIKRRVVGTSTLGVALTIIAALVTGVVLFYVVGKQ